jgi:DNA-binding MarR family transcriptional regulator
LSRDSKRALIRRIQTAMRSADANMDRIEEVAAQRLGLHRTDFRCLDILSRGTALTAGQLAKAAGLSTPAVTALPDRLEQAGYVRRVRDTADRRRVIVEVTKSAVAEVWPIFKGLIDESSAMLEAFRLDDLQTIARFTDLNEALIAAHAAKATGS